LFVFGEELKAKGIRIHPFQRRASLGLSGALQLVGLVVAWRLLAAGGARDLAIEAAEVVRWRA
jgi:hypothetical protein